MTTATTDNATTDARKMGPMMATFLVAGNMIGSGVFLLPATLALIGSVTLIGWIGASVGALLLAAVFAFLARLRPDGHGVVGYVSAALGKFFGFEAGFAYWLSCLVGNLALATAVIGYLTFFFPALKSPVLTTVASLGAIWLLTFANIVGPRFIGRLHGASLAIGLLPIVAATVLGWIYFDPHIFQQSWNVTAILDPAHVGKTDGQAISGAIVPIFWAFLGLESASVCARVVRDPKKNVPLATFGGVGLAAVIYIAASAAVFGVLPATVLAASSAPFADVGAKLVGATLGGLLAACAVFKAAGTLGGWVMVTAQTTQAGVEAGYLPRILSKPDTPHAPTRELLIMGFLMTAIGFATIQPTIAQQFGVLINVATNLSLAVYGLCCIALLRWSGELQKHALTARICAVLGLGFAVWAIASGDPEMLKVQAGLFVVSLPLWALIWWTGRPKTAP